ncbi:hypothetical protein HRF87_05705 [Bacillus sp. CRN 9]|nr:hypothetical protein [Bacillus sp. CRN 9]
MLKKQAVALRKLNAEFKKVFSLEEQESAEFYVDECTLKHYIWSFTIRKKKFKFIYNLKTKKIEKTITTLM